MTIFQILVDFYFLVHILENSKFPICISLCSKAAADSDSDLHYLERDDVD